MVGYQDGPPPTHIEMSMGTEGGTIGRSADNDFVIYDPERFASRYHARVFYDDGVYRVQDTSSSGTLVNDDIDLEPGQSVDLQDGDILTIGYCAIEVQIREDIDQVDPRDPAADRTLKQVPDSDDLISQAFNFDAAEKEVEEINQRHTPLPPDPRQAKTRFAEDDEVPGHGGPETHQGRPEPRPAAYRDHDARDLPPAGGSPQPAAKVFDREDRTGPSPNPRPAQQIQQPVSAPPQQPVSSPMGAPAADGGMYQEAIDAFLSEFNMRTDHLKDKDLVETLQMTGFIFKTLTQAMMEVLSARNSLKKGFGLDTTKIKGTNNNALKFSATAEEAIFRMLTAEKGFLDPLDAAEEAANDARAHQVALMSGMSAAVQAIISRFDPEKLEKELDDGFAINKRAKNWELYIEKFQQIAEESERSFNELFADEFARSYDEQVRKLEQEKHQDQ